jgi:DNA-binding transcriptional MerR regulator
MPDSNYYSTSDIHRITGLSIRAIQLWAAANGVRSIGTGRGKTYLWTKADVERFKARDTRRGRRWPGKG